MKLIDIIETIKSGGSVKAEDMKYAICALDYLLTFEKMAISKLAEGKREGKKQVLVYDPEHQFNESFRRIKTAMQKEPKDWLGWDNDPDNPAYQERRKISFKLFDKIISGIQ